MGMLRGLLVLAVVVKVVKVWKAHVKRSDRHALIEAGRGESERSGEEALSDCCCVS